MRMTILFTLVSMILPLPVRAATPASSMLELTFQGQRIEGLPLTWDHTTAILLGRDGQLWDIPLREASDFRKTLSHFQPYSLSELRATLLRELGGGYEVTSTSHYLIAHPQGRRDVWAQRFEELYRSLVRYFFIRGLTVKEPPFPLIGIVYRSQQDFVRGTAASGTPVGGGVVGCYQLRSNRILLYEPSDGPNSAFEWQQGAATAVHEATHQTAFNTGLHSRYAPPPTWLAEGLATMFEARGVYDSSTYRNRRDRINDARFAQFRQGVAPQHRPELLTAIVSSDRLFSTSPDAAYAEAWALTFYLVETQSRQYADYLARTAQRPAFQPYNASERLADFTAVFGSDWRMLEARLLRFMEELGG